MAEISISVIVQQEVEALELLNTLTQEQLSFIQQDNLDGLEINLGQRQTVLDQLLDMERQLDQLRRLPNKQDPMQAISAAQDLQPLYERRSALYATACALDKQVNALAAAKLEEYRESMKASIEGQKVLGEYLQEFENLSGSLFSESR